MGSGFPPTSGQIPPTSGSSDSSNTDPHMAYSIMFPVKIHILFTSWQWYPLYHWSSQRMPAPPPLPLPPSLLPPTLCLASSPHSGLSVTSGHTQGRPQGHTHSKSLGPYFPRSYALLKASSPEDLGFCLGLRSSHTLLLLSRSPRSSHALSSPPRSNSNVWGPCPVTRSILTGFTESRVTWVTC